MCRNQEPSNRKTIFDFWEVLCRLNKVEEEKVSIESQIRNEELQMFLQIQAL